MWKFCKINNSKIFLSENNIKYQICALKNVYISLDKGNIELKMIFNVSRETKFIKELRNYCGNGGYKMV